ncbi:MAG: Nramp family divalent metal transporter [Pseudomonadota bacterium]
MNFFKYLGPGLLVTVGFTDPGNWASNIAAGSMFGYELLWVVSLSTVMLIILQHNVAHLGIVSGLCLAEAATIYTPRWVSRGVLATATMASIATSLAEVLGGALALNMLFNIPIKIAAIFMVLLCSVLIFTNSYRRLEKTIIVFVSIIGFSFLYELCLVNVQWPMALQSFVTPHIPPGSMVIIMSVLGAVVMPHNLFLHSEIIQSRQWNLKDDKIIKKQLDYEFFDTLFSMIVGWAINSAMIILAAATFFKSQIKIDDLAQAQSILHPLLGTNAAVVFAMALLFSGLSSTVTSGMAGGSIFAGIFQEPYDAGARRSRQGILISFLGALLIVFFIKNIFQALIISQVVLSLQLPFTIFLQIYLTSSKRVMGKFANPRWSKILLIFLGTIVVFLNLKLFWDILHGTA